MLVKQNEMFVKISIDYLGSSKYYFELTNCIELDDNLLKLNDEMKYVGCNSYGEFYLNMPQRKIRSQLKKLSNSAIKSEYPLIG